MLNDGYFQFLDNRFEFVYDCRLRELYCDLGGTPTTELRAADGRLKVYGRLGLLVMAEHLTELLTKRHLTAALGLLRIEL